MGAFMFQSVILLLLSKIVFDKGLSLYGKFAFTAILAIIFAAFIFTYSRGAWITTLIGVFILIRFRKILILPAILLPIILIPFLPEAISNRIISIFDSDRTSTVYLYRDVKINNTTSLRLGNWKNTLSDINEKPMLGHGLGFYHGDDKGEYAPHNTYLRIWAEAGIIAIFGFFLFLYNLISIFEKVIPLVDGKWKWIIIGNYSIVVTHMFYMILGDWAYQMYYWVFTGIASASVNLFVSRGTKTKSISENSQN
jgi:O-antigen ligase